MDSWKNCIESISNITGSFIPLVEIGCSTVSWTIFMIYLKYYYLKDITGYEYYNNYVFVFQGSGPREWVSDPDCEYVEKESIGNNLVSYLNYFSKSFLVTIGIIWIIIAGIFIVFLGIYFLFDCAKFEINKRRKVYFNGMKLIFDFVIPLVMTPISSV